MVIKICKICGKEFDARGAAKCCSPECRKINERNLHKKANKKWRANNRDKKHEYYENNRDDILKKQKEYRENHRDKISKYNKKYYENHRDERLKYSKEYYKNNVEHYKKYNREYYKTHRDEIHKNVIKWQKNNPDKVCKYKRKWYKNNPEYSHNYNKKLISELCEQYHGDLKQILENILNTTWHDREAKMQIWFGKSYADGMIAKIQSTPVCEVTGEKKDLVIHHLYSFNTHPELGDDPNNMVRITSAIHDEFHSIYGRGDNTPEQWYEFLQKRGDS